MAQQLISSLTEDFDPSAWQDEYRDKVLAAVQAKVEGQEIVVQADEDEPATVVDLMEALRASVDEAKSRRGGSSAGAGGRKSKAS